jgi:hypothetical protein
VNRSISARRSGSLSRFSRTDTGGTVICTICHTVYAPSRSHEYLLQAPPLALESAFMSMCHFCFRCRRPACPNCWDDVHGVCGQCAEETRLPFRLAPAPLDGVPFVPPRHASISGRPHAIPSSLVTIQPGRFQQPSLPPIDSITTRPDRSSTVEARPAAASPGRSIAIDEVITHPPAVPRRSSAPSLSPDIDQMKTRPEQSKRRTHRPGRVFATLAFALLLVGVILIVAASLSSTANAFIYTVLHVDIRAEIAYLWHLLQQLF